ncbi:MAG: cysteine--tRNA ligase, partial [Candidatus Doudnabacteria bacterium]|nr:cysteine--tRNA ligase [Candidatus Doudnabacteria bacterium]
MKLYNTLTKKVEELGLSKNEPVRMYTCGPTVYNYAHIGNFRSYLFADSIYRTLKYTGHTVDWVMNLTDVDDKTIRD